MRFEAKRINPQFFGVVDTDEADRVVYRSKLMAYAINEADRLNANPPPGGPRPKRKWDYATAGENVLDTYLNNGWEPFAVSDGLIHLRKPYTVGGNP